MEPKEHEKLVAVYNPNPKEQDWELDWEDCVNDLQVWVDKQKDKSHVYAYVWVKDFGWRKSSGHTSFKLGDASGLLYTILPKTDCIFYIFETEDPMYDYKLRIVNYHHDAPTGETYYLRFLTDLEYESME
jgi:hypothetical protein